MPLGFWLLALACVPFLAATWFASGEIESSSDDREVLAVFDDSVEDFVDVNGLRHALLVERKWVLVNEGVTGLGATVDEVQDLTGINLASELDEARRLVDTWMVATATPDEFAALDLARSASNLANDGSGYLETERLLAVRSDWILGELRDGAGQLDQGHSLGEALWILDLASRSTISTTIQHTSYFAALFDLNVPDGPRIALLLSERAVHDASIDAMRTAIVTGSQAELALEALIASDGVSVIDQAIDDIVQVSITEGPGTVELSALTLFEDLDQVVAMFKGALSSEDAHVAVVTAAANDAEQASAELIAQGMRSARTSGIASAVALALAISLLVAVGVFITTPLRRLLDGANELTDGSPISRAKPRGPREIRRVQTAIAEAADNLKLTERQASALAAGELDSPVLNEIGPGPLGKSLQAAVSRLSSSLAEAELYRDQLSHEAAHDALTGLSNRKASLDRLVAGLARTRRNESSALAVLFIDLDGFKKINDTFGHLAGDEILRETAERLADTARTGDHVGRLGGDEFLFIAEPVHGIEETVRLANRLRRNLAEPIYYDGVELTVGSSIGIALTETGDVMADDMLLDADIALYRAKELGRGRVEVCNEELQAQIREASSLEVALAAGVENDELVLHYQPVVDHESNSVTSLEAFVRWDRPGHAVLMPSDFIGFATERELMADIDRWVITEAIRQLGEWSATDDLTAVRVSVNVSIDFLLLDSFVDHVLASLAEHDVEPSRLIVEVTETMLMNNQELVASRFLTLRNAGIATALDDFGTASSLLAQLRALSFDIIKIDGSFVSDPRAASLVKLMIDAGHGIGASMIAEGVETKDQAASLTRLGCDELQGFLFAEPCDADQVRAEMAAKRKLAAAGSVENGSVV